MKEALLRNEAEPKYKWRVEDIYATDEAWEQDYKRLLEKIELPCTYQGKLADSAGTLAAALKEYDELDLAAERIYVYAFMKYYEDTAASVYQELSGKAHMAITKLGEKYAFLEPEILSIPDDAIKEYLKAEEIQPYHHFLCDMLAEKEHSLSEKEERILAMAGQISSSASDIFSKFNNADIAFGMVKDEEGSEIELTHGRYAMLMESNNREVRKDAFTALYRQYKAHINTLAAAYYANVKQAMFYAKARNYNSTLERYLSGSFIPVSVYENLISTVNENLHYMHDYVKLRKKELGVEELHFYDIYAPMVPEVDMKVSYEEAKNIILEALKPLGEEYTAKVKEGLESGWVDVYENKGKRSGAFSWGTYGVHPYLFLNYTDTLNDVFTLIHEMGHAMHTYYSNENQPHIYAGYRIFVAEVASTCNEALLMQYLLNKCTDPQERKYLVNHYLEQFKGTLFRQTMFAEFEMITHRMAEEGQVLSANNLCDIYRELNEKYFGEDMVMDDEIALEWSRIPHFYTPFYVYQYATGFSAAIAIASKILAGDEKVIAGYKKFLSGGSSMHPIELLALCDVDMSKPKVIQEAIDVFAQLLREW